MTQPSSSATTSLLVQTSALVAGRLNYAAFSTARTLRGEDFT